MCDAIDLLEAVKMANIPVGLMKCVYNECMQVQKLFVGVSYFRSCRITGFR